MSVHVIIEEIIMKPLIIKIITILSALGMIVTGYLVYQHYKPVDTSFCNFSDYVNCDIVNKSEYSEILGTPVSMLGFIAYAYLFVFAISVLKKASWTESLLIPTLIFAIVGLAFSGYLTYIEFFVLYAVCVFCLAQQLIILIITTLLGISVWHSKKQVSPSHSS